MTYLYVLIGIVFFFILFSFVTYQVLAWLIVRYSSTPLSEDQKEVCKTTLKKGKKPSPYCGIYIKNGKCGHKDCAVTK